MTESKMQAEKTLTSETVFEGRLVRLRVDTVTLGNGREASREVVEHRPAVVIVPIDGDGNVVMVRQFRYAVGEPLLELPAGGVEESETPSVCALRELREETGYAPGSLLSLGRFWTSPGFCDELMYAYVARDLVLSPLQPDADEDIQAERVPLSKVQGLIRDGQIQDGKSIAALLMATCVFEQG